MAWAKPQHHKREINDAGRELAAKGLDGSEARTLNVINNLRSCHGFPLQVIKMTLLNRARKVDSQAIVAQRLKRLSSIELKLKRFRQMELSYMQDIGGCRAVVKSVKDVYELVELYRKSNAKNPTGRHQFVKENDYVMTPKPDGYRSVHLVYRYQSLSSEHAIYNGLNIEIQIRSKLQHAWATAVETVGTFLQQALKSNQGEEAWLRFFSLMGSAIALREKQPIVHGTPDTRKELVSELKTLAKSLDVAHRLAVYGDTVKAAQDPDLFDKDHYYYLLVQNPVQGQTIIYGFSITELDEAIDQYLATEKELAGVIGAEAVLVSVDTLAALRRAYPNYFLDTKLFLQLLKETISAGA